MGDGKLDRLFARWRRRQDVEALGRLFDAAAPELMRIARHLARDAAEAEDVVQATFLTAMERAASFDGERRFMPWAAGILANHARNARRRRRPHEDEERLLELAGDDDAVGRAAEAELRSAVERAVSELAPAERAVVTPMLASGARPAEIAATLGITPGAARVRLHRGLARLRAALPPSFAAGAVVSLSTPRGLAAVRAEVLASASRLGAPTALSTASATLGGALVTQRILIGALVAVALLGGMVVWQPWERSDAATRGDAIAVASSEEAALPAVASELPATAPSAAADGVAAARESADSAATLVTFHGTLVAYDTRVAVADARVLTQPHGDDEPVLRARSDSSGGFILAAPLAELETLVVEADGFATRRVPLTGWRRAEFWRRAGRADPFPEGEVQELGALALLPALALRARVEREEDGGPVAGAELFLFWQPWSDAPQVLEDRPIGKTDGAGRAVFDGALPAHGEEGDDGNLLLFAFAPGRVGWARVAATPRGVVDEEVVIATHAAARLEVRVLDLAGAPLAGARVSAVPLTSPFPARAGWMRDRYPPFFPLGAELARAFEARADADGRARLDRLLRGASRPYETDLRARYDVRVQAEGYVDHAELVDLGSELEGELVVTLSPERETTLAGRVTDRAGAPLAEAEVTSAAGDLSTRTDAEGRWTLTWPADGSRSGLLRAELAGYARGSLRFELDGAPVRRDGLDLVLGRPAPIAGEVTDQHGRPVVEARVAILRPEALEALDRGEGVAMPRELQARSDELGRFRIEAAEEGEWLLWVQPPHPRAEWGPAPDYVPVNGGDDALHVTLERREVVATRLVVEFLDAHTGAPVDPSAVSLLQSGEHEPAAYGMAERGPGTVSWEVNVPKHYTLFCALANGAKATAEIDVAGGGEQRERVEVGAPGVLRGRVDFGALERPEKVSVIANLVVASGAVPGGEEWTGGAQTYAGAHAAPDGRFALENLVPGTWEVLVRAHGAWVEPRRFEVPFGGEAREHHLVAEPGAVLELTPERAPGGGWVEPAFLDADGEWKVPSIVQGEREPPHVFTRTFPPGEVRWRMRFVEQPWKEDGRLARDQEGTATIGAGETLRVTVPVEPLD